MNHLRQLTESYRGPWPFDFLWPLGYHQRTKKAPKSISVGLGFLSPQIEAEIWPKCQKVCFPPDSR